MWFSSKYVLLVSVNNKRKKERRVWNQLCDLVVSKKASEKQKRKEMRVQQSDDCKQKKRKGEGLKKLK